MCIARDVLADFSSYLEKRMRTYRGGVHFCRLFSPVHHLPNSLRCSRSGIEETNSYGTNIIRTFSHNASQAVDQERICVHRVDF